MTNVAVLVPPEIWIAQLDPFNGLAVGMFLRYGKKKKRKVPPNSLGFEIVTVDYDLKNRNSSTIHGIAFMKVSISG